MPESSLEQAVIAHVTARNAAGEQTRRDLLERSFAADGTYADPSATVGGREALVAHSRRFAQRRPGSRITVTSAIDVHDDVACFTWQVLGPDGATVVEGIDFVTAGPDGRVARGARVLRRLSTHVGTTAAGHGLGGASRPTAPPPADADHPDLRGKVVLVTGAGSGIGRAMTVAFARQGALPGEFHVHRATVSMACRGSSSLRAADCTVISGALSFRSCSARRCRQLVSCR